MENDIDQLIGAVFLKQAERKEESIRRLLVPFEDDLIKLLKECVSERAKTGSTEPIPITFRIDVRELVALTLQRHTEIAAFLDRVEKKLQGRSYRITLTDRKTVHYDSAGALIAFTAIMERKTVILIPQSIPLQSFPGFNGPPGFFNQEGPSRIPGYF
jgi:hypothetical protein